MFRSGTFGSGRSNYSTVGLRAAGDGTRAHVRSLGAAHLTRQCGRRAHDHTQHPNRHVVEASSARSGYGGFRNDSLAWDGHACSSDDARTDEHGNADHYLR
jgi:hypothetical protein